MTVEADLYTALGALVSNRAYPFVQPIGATLPCIVYQQIGGESASFLELTMPSKKNAQFQVRTWASTYKAAVALARDIEDALVVSTTLRASAVGALIADYASDTNEFGTIQQFSIWFDD